MRDILVPIDKAGRVVLPKNVREELAINPGDLLRLSIRGDAVTMRVDGHKEGLVRKGKALVFSTGKSGVLSREAVEEVREGVQEGNAGRIHRGLGEKGR